MKHLINTSQTTIKRFSLIEIMLALVVLVVGIIGIMGLMSVSVDTKKDTMQQSSATDAAEQFLHFNSSKIKSDWEWTNAIPMNNKFSGDDSTISWSTTDLLADNPNVDIYFQLNSGDQPDVAFDTSAHQSGVFKMVQKTQGNVDFSCIMRTWQTYGSIVLHTECSYPAELPYGSRTKDEFSVRCVRNASVHIEDGPTMGKQVANSAMISNSECDDDKQININPGNSNQNNQFCLLTPDDIVYTRENMLAGTLGTNGQEYWGPAKKLFFRPKTTSSKLMINGKVVTLAQKSYELVGEIDVYIYNSSLNPTSNNGMGHWWACITAWNATLTEDATNTCGN